MLLNYAIVPALCFHLRNNIVVYALLCFPDVTEHFWAENSTCILPITKCADVFSWLCDTGISS